MIVNGGIARAGEYLTVNRGNTLDGGDAQSKASFHVPKHGTRGTRSLINNVLLVGYHSQHAQTNLHPRSRSRYVM